MIAIKTDSQVRGEYAGVIGYGEASMWLVANRLRSALETYDTVPRALLEEILEDLDQRHDELDNRFEQARI